MTESKVVWCSCETVGPICDTEIITAETIGTDKVLAEFVAGNELAVFVTRSVGEIAGNVLCDG